jgi:hypothetical protein
MIIDGAFAASALNVAEVPCLPLITPRLQVTHHHEAVAAHGFTVFPDAAKCVSQYARRCLDAVEEWSRGFVPPNKK